MDFKAYGSIKNTYDERTVRAAFNAGLGQSQWIATEKVHGANFGFWIDADTIRCARRTAFLEVGDVFHGWQDLLETHRSALMTIFEVLRETRAAERIVVYGEVFGGSYPHPDVPAIHDVSRVQGAVYYAPDVRFYAFDIVVHTGTAAFYLDILEANRLFETVELFYARPIVQGTLQTLLDAPNLFETHIPGWLGLPTIPDNMTEGLVIRHPGDHPVGQTRLIFKSKNSRFRERTARNRQAVRAVPEIVALSEEATEVFAELMRYVTASRYAAVRSKELQTAPIPKLVGLCVRDILTDFNVDQPDALSALEKKERKRLSRMLMAEVSKIAWAAI